MHPLLADPEEMYRGVMEQEPGPRQLPLPLRIAKESCGRCGPSTRLVSTLRRASASTL